MVNSSVFWSDVSVMINILYEMIILRLPPSSSLCEGGATGFLNSTKSGGNWNFSKSRGEEKEAGKGSFEIFIGGEIAGDETSNRKQNFRMNLKMFWWVI